MQLVQELGRLLRRPALLRLLRGIVSQTLSSINHAHLFDVLDVLLIGCRSLVDVLRSTCSNHGQCTGTGSCQVRRLAIPPVVSPLTLILIFGAAQCDAGFAAPNCNYCLANFYAYPTCQCEIH